MMFKMNNVINKLAVKVNLASPLTHTHQNIFEKFIKRKYTHTYIIIVQMLKLIYSIKC
jgi:hypothetical protein